MTAALKVEGLGKRYQLRCEKGRVAYRTLREDLADLPGVVWNRMRSRKNVREEFWALRDVSFEVPQGEVLGIIGRNGAGKSTLLKILGRIVDPTAGYVDLRGRVGSLLEVGTGFHPELTGRENIYLSGALLGMRRSEVRRHFDEIVAFAEVEHFVNTPCKHYSSGMYMRLAFAVAAFLETEIILLDEVLAVGDAEFQRRCLSRVGTLAGEGRTVLIVSHNLAQVENLCGSAILLEKGRCRAFGPARDVIDEYRDGFVKSGFVSTGLRERPRRGQLEAVIDGIQFRDDDLRLVSGVGVGEALVIDVHYRHHRPILDPAIGLIVSNPAGVHIFWVNTKLQGFEAERVEAEGVVRCRIPSLPLIPGTYSVTIGCRSGGAQLDYLEAAASLDVFERDYFGSGALPASHQGLVVVDAHWNWSVIS